MGKGKRNRAAHAAEERIPRGMTPAEYQAINSAIDRQILERCREYDLDVVAAFLWTLHQTFGFGRVRLRKVWDRYHEQYLELRARYEMPDGETLGVCRTKLKDMGVDIDAWDRETRMDYNNY